MTRATLALTACLTALTVTTGCAQQTDQPTASLTAMTGAERLTDTIDRIYGTATQRQAGQERAFYTLQAAIAACAREKGFDYVVPGYTSIPVTDRIAPGELLGYAPRRADYGTAQQITALAATGDRESPSKTVLTGEARQDWITRYNQCFEPATTATDGDEAADGSYSLSAKLVEHLVKLETELAPGLPAAYSRCMTAAGIPVSEDPSDAMILVDQKYPRINQDAPSDPTRLPGWTEAVAFDRSTAAADWQCRGTQSTQLIDASAAQLTTWTEQNKPAIDAVANAWAAMPAARDTAKAAIRQ